jgi:nucleoside-diphosphate-sugar epimerase
MRCAVTGGTGFIGRELVMRLTAAGHVVKVLTRRAVADAPSGVTHVRGDLARESPPAAFLTDVDVLFHCAGEITDPAKMMALHVDGTRRLIDAAAGNVRRWVQLSSVGAYGPRPALVVRENSPERPLGAYEITKTMADELVRQAAAQGVFDYTLLRPSTVFGNGMPNRSLAQWIAAIRRGLFFYIGAPGAMVNYVHVASVIDALIRCALPAAAGKTYIVSEAMTIEHFVETICRALEQAPPRLRLPETVARTLSAAGGFFWKDFPLTPSRIDALTDRTVYSSARIGEELGYAPSVPLTEGLKNFVAYWRSRDGGQA